MTASHVRSVLTLALLVAVHGCAGSKSGEAPVATGSQEESTPKPEATPQPVQPPAPAPPPAVSEPAAPATPAPAPPPPAAAPPPQAPPTPGPERPPASRGQSLVLYVKAATANLREAPDSRATKVVAVVTKGARLTVMAKSNQWYLVKLEDGTEGWIAESAVGKNPR